MKKISRALITIFITIILLLAYSEIGYAINNSNELNLILPKKSEAFKRWENLPDEENENFIQPLYSDTSFKDSIKRSKYNAIMTLGVNDVIDKKYENRNNIVKNQLKVGHCWAFSFSSMIESTISKQYNKKATEYSPIHVVYMINKMYNKTLNSGGNAYLALAYSVAGYGPVYESQFKFTDFYDEENNDEQNEYLKPKDEVNVNIQPQAIIEDSINFPSIYKSYANSNLTYEGTNNVKYDENQVNEIRNLIKKHIKEKGAVCASMYYSSKDGVYYNKKTKAYYCNNSLENMNHGVTIVGWDDNFKKENFTEGKQPPKDGAYIVLNSYGDNFGENGYFYISYYDLFIERAILGINSIKEYDTDEKDYENIYQYDELGSNFSGKISDKDSYFAANVFTKKDTQKQEYISKIGLYMNTTEGVEVYINPADDDQKKLGKPVASYTGSNALEEGYHTIELSSPVKITGNKFVVAVKYINKELIDLPLEANLTDCELSKKASLFDTAKSNKGESFISENGYDWSDLYGLTINDVTLKNTNACIKAITLILDEEVTPPSPSPSPSPLPSPSLSPSPSPSPSERR